VTVVILTDIGSAEWAEQFIHRDQNGDVNLGLTEELLPRSDIKSAEVIRDHYRGQISYGTQTKQWYLWDGTVHRPCNNGDVDRLIHIWAWTLKAAVDCVRDHYELQAASAPDQPTRDRIMKNYQDNWKQHRAYRDRLFNDAGQKAVISQLKSMCAVDESEFDSDGKYFVVENGVMNMDIVEKTGEVKLLQHDPARKLTKKSTVVYDPDVQWDRTWWHHYLKTSLPDPEVRSYLQRWAGSSLLGKPNSKGLVNLIGPQDSGKSLFINAILDVMGDYGKGVRAAAFLAKKNGDSGYDMHELRGARFVTASEPGRGKQLDDDAVKTVTGNDMMRTREPYGRFVSWKPQCTIFIASNAPMRMDTADGALLNRIKPIVFPKSFKRGSDVPPEERAEPKLAEYLTHERSAILNWMLDGLRDFLRQGLGDEPESVVEGRRQMAIEIDSCLQWLQEEIEAGNIIADRHAPISHCIQVSTAFARYVSWCEETHEKGFGRRNFSASIKREYPTVISGGYRFKGLVLHESLDPERQQSTPNIDGL
jgi:putative DNA primase/helicase